MPVSSVNVLVVGSMNMDFILKVDEHAVIGGHVQAKEQLQMTGGHGANQAVACVRQSSYRERRGPAASFQDSLHHSHESGVKLSVSIIGAVGDTKEDNFGNQIVDRLSQEGVDIKGVAKAACKTGFAHIHVDSSGEPLVANWPGANFFLKPDHVTWSPTTRPDMILVQLEIPIETVARVLEKAHEEDIPVLLNAAPPNVKFVTDMCDVDYLVMNKLRADSYRGLDPKKDWPISGYIDMCRELHVNKAKMVIVTLGNLGVVASRANEHGRPTTWDMPAHHVKDDSVVDTTGGSDAFIGAFVAEILRQKNSGKTGEPENVERALNMGLAAGAHIVTEFGSMDELPYRDDVE